MFSYIYKYGNHIWRSCPSWFVKVIKCDKKRSRNFNEITWIFSAPPPPGLSLPNNPGTIEELHKKCQGVFPVVFDGATLRVNKGLNSHFQVSHTLNLPTNPQSPSGYKFGATYVGKKMLSPTEVDLIYFTTLLKILYRFFLFVFEQFDGK